MHGNYTVNIITSKDAFKAWGLPNRNYTKAGVTLKENADLNSFRRKWTEIMIKAGYMESVDVFSIIEEKERKQNQVMAIFYSVIGILLIICVLRTSNSIVMRICHMAEEQRTLHLLGMTKTRLLIEMTGLKERQTHLPSELSGGQKQCAAIARALINKPDVIMADEPTGNLDQATGMEIMQIFTEIHKQGKTIIIVTHDANIAGQCQHEIKISDGRII